MRTLEVQHPLHSKKLSCEGEIVERVSRAGPRGRGREWATLGVHPLSWLLSNNRLEKVPVVSVPHTSSNRLLLSNQDKGCTPSVAHSLPLPLDLALLNLWTVFLFGDKYGIFRVFPGGDMGLDWGSPPQAAKILLVPQTDHSPHFFDQSLSLNWVLSPKISNILTSSFSQFLLLFGSKLHQIAPFMFKHKNLL